MNWQYSDYLTLDDPQAKIERLRLHIVEVSDRLLEYTSRSGLDGMSWSRSSNLSQYLQSLKTELNQLAPRPSAAFIGLR